MYVVLLQKYSQVKKGAAFCISTSTLHTALHKRERERERQRKKVELEELVYGLEIRSDSQHLGFGVSLGNNKGGEGAKAKSQQCQSLVLTNLIFC
jgi:hypothetical protein